MKRNTLLKGSTLALGALVVTASFLLSGCGSSANDAAASDPNYKKDLAPKASPKGAATAAKGAKGGPELAGD